MRKNYAPDKPTLQKAIVLYVLLTAISITTVTPLLWMLSTSVKTPGTPDAAFLPGTPTLSNYEQVLATTPFGRYYFNSILIVSLITIGQLVTSSLAAYAFARLRFPGRDKIFIAYLATMMIPEAVTMVPLFMMLTRTPLLLNDLFGTSYFTDDLFFFGIWHAGRAIGVDSYLVLIAPRLFSPFGTFLLRQFFMTIPRDLDEAAMLDGCGKFRIFTQIILPLSRPALAALAIFTFITAWGEFLWPLIMTNRETMRPLPVGLAMFITDYATEWKLLMAGATLMLVPLLVLFVTCQRFFVKGIQLGAIKG